MSGAPHVIFTLPLAEYPVEFLLSAARNDATPLLQETCTEELERRGIGWRIRPACFCNWYRENGRTVGIGNPLGRNSADYMADLTLKVSGRRRFAILRVYAKPQVAA